MNKTILEMRSISKSFPGVRALRDVSFTVAEGEIHCLVGENGAGKSTLMKILSGVYPHGSYDGEILFNGSLQTFRGIADSKKAGIAIIYQELALVPEMSIYENIYLGNEPKRGISVDWNLAIKNAREILQKVRLKVDPDIKVKHLGVGQQQLVEIAKALSKNVKLLILDEPTAALNEDDCDNLLDLILTLKKQGVTSILITHKLKEVLRIADTVTVLRDGSTVATLNASKGEVTQNSMIKHMVGREITEIYPRREARPQNLRVLEVSHLSAYDPVLGREVIKDISFFLNKGEIIGLAGLMGSGRTEIAKSIFGNAAGYRLQGEVKLKGNAARCQNPSQAITSGIAYASEDRKKNGLILINDVKQNITLAHLKEISSYGIVDKNREIKIAKEYCESLNIKTPSVDQLTMNLSGGNQQKVSIAKWIFIRPDVLILDEPTRGIDVGAKFEIYTIMNKLVSEGMSIIMISSELPEVLGMSDRVYVVSSGRITGELPRSEATQERIMEMATS